MKKNGFTISEALIVLAIIGIISVLSIPTFISGQRKNAYSNILNIAVSNFNSAMNTLIMQEGVDNLFETSAWRRIEDTGLSIDSNGDIIDNFKNNINSALKIVSNPNETTTYTTPNGRDYEFEFGDSQPARFITKNGVEYLFYIDPVLFDSPPKSETEALSANTHYTHKAADVYIDINGSASPNIIGRDLFRYELDAKGTLYPYGGTDYNFYYDIVDPDDIQTRCRQNSNDSRDKDYCAAYLMNNGYNMDY